MQSNGVDGLNQPKVLQMLIQNNPSIKNLSLDKESQFLLQVLKGMDLSKKENPFNKRVEIPMQEFSAKAMLGGSKSSLSKVGKRHNMLLNKRSLYKGFK